MRGASIKKILPVLFLLCLLLTACDLRNRQSSENFIPTGDEYSDEPFIPSAFDTVVPVLEDRQIKIVLSERGEYLFTNPEIVYSYELPFIDLASEYAVGCNQEIEASFGKAIRDSLTLMEQGEPPVVRTVSCSSYIYGSVLTLRIMREDVDGAVSQAIFSVDRNTGEKVTTDAFCSAAGIRTEMLQEKLNRAIEERLHVLAPGIGSEDPDYIRALGQTQNMLGKPEDLKLYLDPDGTLVCITEIFTPAGGDGMEELRIS